MFGPLKTAIDYPYFEKAKGKGCRNWFCWKAEVTSVPELYFLLVGLCASMRALAIAPWHREKKDVSTCFL